MEMKKAAKHSLKLVCRRSAVAGEHAALGPGGLIGGVAGSLVGFFQSKQLRSLCSKL
jgi:hypothetical protein